MTTPKLENYMRSAELTAQTGLELRQAIASVPGYKQVDSPYELPRNRESDLYVQSLESGVVIRITHEATSTLATTSNMLGQDEHAHTVSIVDDEVVKFANALERAHLHIGVEVLMSRADRGAA